MTPLTGKTIAAVFTTNYEASTDPEWHNLLYLVCTDGTVLKVHALCDDMDSPSLECTVYDAD